MRLFGHFLLKIRRTLVYMALCMGLYAVIIYLYDLPENAAGYAIILWIFLGAGFLAVDFYHFYKKAKALEQLQHSVTSSLEEMPKTDEWMEAQYQECLCRLNEEKCHIQSESDRERKDMLDYYTLWAHQIKTPIAAMSLLLQEQMQRGKTQNPVTLNGQDYAELEGELFKVEQYVDMVLSYLRLGSESNDFVFAYVPLNQMVQSSVRKYAKQFIRKKIALEFDAETMTQAVLTDAKWLEFVLEQILSNAIKYTVKGKIRIYFKEVDSRAESSEAKVVLVVEDTGIGIAPEDLPRICEKGYTGYNGRSGRKSTGIGLYLCKSILNKLGHGLEITSELGVGTSVCIHIGTDKIGVE